MFHILISTEADWPLTRDKEECGVCLAEFERYIKGEVGRLLSGNLCVSCVERVSLSLANRGLVRQVAAS
jgi:hypothetical protein